MALLLTGCFPASIVTVSPYNDYQRSYTTTVTVPRTRTVTTTTRVTPAIEDLSLYLDLQAVGSAFAQSRNIEEFESLLNNSSYIISNLDLNGIDLRMPNTSGLFSRHGRIFPNSPCLRLKYTGMMAE